MFGRAAFCVDNPVDCVDSGKERSPLGLFSPKSGECITSLIVGKLVKR
jgi:hypothetical protein